MPPESTDPQHWLLVSREDLRSARILLDAQPPALYAAAFHAQQSAEKALKAFLVARGQEPPRVHSLDLLFDLCIKLDEGFEPLADRCAWLSDFAVGIRYPGFEPVPDTETVRTAVEDATTLLAFVEQRIDLEPHP